MQSSTVARRRLAALARWLTPLALVAVVVRFVDFGLVGARLRTLDGSWLALALALMPLVYALYAVRWCFTAARVGAPLSLRRAFVEYYVSSLLNQVLPLGVAGDVARAFRHHGRLRGDGAGSLGRAARAVVLERFSGLLGLGLFVALSAGAWLLRGRREFALVGAGALVLVGGSAWWLARYARSAEGSSAAGSDAVGVARLVADGRAALIERGALGVQLALSTAAVALLVAVFVCAARASGASVGLVTALQVVPLVLASTIVPFAFAGWGVREAATVALYHLLGLEAVTAVAVSVTFGLVNLAAASPGLLAVAVVPLLRRRPT